MVYHRGSATLEGGGCHGGTRKGARTLERRVFRTRKSEGREMTGVDQNVEGIREKASYEGGCRRCVRKVSCVPLKDDGKTALNGVLKTIEERV